MKHLSKFFIIIIVIAAIDQLSKTWAINNLADGQVWQVLGSFFQLKLLYNQGGVMGSSLGGSTFYLISSLCVLAFVLYFLYTYRRIWMVATPMAIIAGGAIGNIVDRLQHGQVVDFLDFDFFNINIGTFSIDRWWTFNIADAAISVGVVWLIIYMLFLNNPPRHQASYSTGDSSPASLDN
jgi:signal peptidase II